MPPPAGARTRLRGSARALGSAVRSAPIARALTAPLALACVLVSAPAVADRSFTLFESGQVRPLALSPSGKLLFALNTPDNRVEIYRVKASGLAHRASVPVGLEPVAVAARTDTEVWVVNHLSDSVSVVKLGADGHEARVERTLLVGDEPRDIVFAGPGRDRAFITTGHRGQNSPVDPQLTTPGVGRADVWVFGAGGCDASLGGDPITIVTLFSDTPRALAATPDGRIVYAAAFHSGNRTTAIHELAVPDGFDAGGGVPGPSTNFQGIPAPEVGMILKFNGAHWVDELDRVWDDKVKFSLPDKDVFVIDAMANPPVQLAGSAGFFSGVGTILNNMVVNPVNKKVYVSNTEAFNDVRFEGPGTFAGGSVRGHLHESRITVLGPGSVAPRHLNKHIDYSVCCAPVPNAENQKSLATPLGMAVTRDGKRLYVAALSSNKVGVFSTAALEDDTFVPSTAAQIPLTGGGPTGLALDEDRRRLYVLTRFDNSISIISTATHAEIGRVAMYSPEPPSVTAGRRFLYDASFTSSHGDSACATCHVFGDLDSLAWDLGNPDAAVVNNPGPFVGPLVDPFTGQPVDPDFHPMKGPMTTQSLRGMANHGSMHWRGDRTGGNDAPTVQPDGGTYDEEAAFERFQVGFTDLLGRSAPIPAQDMQAFTDFILQVTYPPNPIRALDNSLTYDQQAGREFFFDSRSDFIGVTCGTCHTFDRSGNPGADAPGFFGADGDSAFRATPQFFKVPHLRNLYQKIGMFGFSDVPTGVFSGNNGFQGDQIRGFGFTHDGALDTVFRFMSILGFSPLPLDPVPNPEGFPPPPAGDPLRRQVESFLLAFDSNLAPIVGQQVTLSGENAAAAGPRVDLLIARAEAGECDLVAKGWLSRHNRGFLYVGAGQFMRDRALAPSISDTALRTLALGAQGLTYTCVPPGSGERIGVDRDSDGYLDGDEEHAGSDPADPSSTP
ncbi:hypothetical protein WMF30_30590 [Sorangium sp. So ce134]